jgi:hypothetical protein
MRKENGEMADKDLAFLGGQTHSNPKKKIYVRQTFSQSLGDMTSLFGLTADY